MQIRRAWLLLNSSEVNYIANLEKSFHFDLGPGKLLEFEKMGHLSWNFAQLPLKMWIGPGKLSK